MAYQLGDIFIGDFPVTQDFGANPLEYSSRYPGLKGHNGTDFGCPTGTMILSAADGVVASVGFDAGGYGNYVVINHSGYATLYGHLNDYTVKTGDKVVSGQLIGHSNNTGNSTGPHLHFGVKPIDAQGNKTEAENGYSGYIDPMGSLCEWHVKNLTAPVVPQEDPIEKPVEVDAKEFPIMVSQGANYKVIANFVLGNGLNDFLTNNGQGPIDFKDNPGDPNGGNKINMYIADLMAQIREQRDELTNLRRTIASGNQVVVDNPSTLTDQQKTSLLQNVFKTVKGFIFVQS